MPLNPLSRKVTSWPFAKNSDKDSIDEYLGILYPSRLGGGIHHWKAKGEASRWFEDSIQPTILEYINKNCERVHESNDILLIVICMVGKKVEQTKPVVFLVSDDKAARKEAFDAVKDSQIMDSFPGFELGHTDSGAVKLFSDEVASLSCEIRFTEDGEVLQLVRQPEKSGDVGLVATAGGIVTHCGRYMLLTVDHFLECALQESDETSSDPWQQEEGLEECEITGLDDFDDNDEVDDIEVTSGASQSDLDGLNSDTEELSDANDLSANSDTDSVHTKTTIRPTTPVFVSTLGPEITANHDLEAPQPRDTSSASEVQNGGGLGSPVAQHRELDYNLIEIDSASFAYIPKRLFQQAIPFGDNTGIERAPREATVWTLTASGGKVKGYLSGAVHHIRLPNSKTFIEVYMAKFSQPLAYGDCGAWVRDTATGRLYGHVIVGSLTSGQVVIVPARDTFKHARSLNKPRESAQLFNTPRAFAEKILKRCIPDIESDLQNWADPNTVVDNLGTTALRYAAFCSDVELLSLLKFYGAIIDSKKVNGLSILFMTVCNVPRFLRARPPDMELDRTLRRYSTIDKTDETVLEALKLIFLAPSVWEDLDDSLDEPDLNGVTPLMAAAENGFEKTVAYLLGLGANPKKTDGAGQTAYAHAMKAGKNRTAGLLRDAVAKWPAESQSKRWGTLRISSSADHDQKQPTHSSALTDPDIIWCEFSKFGGCHATFRLADGEAWISHHMDHLRHSPLHPPVFPDRLSCWFCGCPFVACEIGDEQSQKRAFGRRMRHIYLHIADAYTTDRRSIKDQSQPDELMAKHMTEMDLLNRPRPVVGQRDIRHKFLDYDDEFYLELSARLRESNREGPAVEPHDVTSDIKFTPASAPKMEGGIGGSSESPPNDSLGEFESEDEDEDETDDDRGLFKGKTLQTVQHHNKPVGTI